MVYEHGSQKMPSYVLGSSAISSDLMFIAICLRVSPRRWKAIELQSLAEGEEMLNENVERDAD